MVVYEAAGQPGVFADVALVLLGEFAEVAETVEVGEGVVQLASLYPGIAGV